MQMGAVKSFCHQVGRQERQEIVIAGPKKRHQSDKRADSYPLKNRSHERTIQSAAQVILFLFLLFFKFVKP